MLLLFRIGFLEMSWIDMIDILLVAILINQLYLLVRGSVAMRIVVGGGAIVMMWVLVRALEMELFSTILGQFIEGGVIVALILFQQEIRKFLLMIGKGNYLSRAAILRFFWRSTMPKSPIKVEIFVEAAQELSASSIGALIVFTKSSELKFYAESGDPIDAIASKRLIISIFNKYSPLHDGAMIIGRRGRINSARCILPVSDNQDLPANLGLRHRSAIGLTEITDAVVLVVSEETGAISLVKNGQIMRNLSAKELKVKLNKYLIKEEEEEENKDSEEHPPTKKLNEPNEISAKEKII